MSERTAEAWGRLAVSLPGWRWMPGMQACEDDRIIFGGTKIEGDHWPDPDDPATEGCMVRLLGPVNKQISPPFMSGSGWVIYSIQFGWVGGSTLGRACIAVAEAFGRWPGGTE
jgi:hypothetical protein